MDGSKEMHPDVTPIAEAGRALTAPPPTMADAAFLADSGFILEP
jgi:hypothetical protein